MSTFETELDALAAATGFTGVVRIDRPGKEHLARAYGLADRGWGIPNETDTRFGIASGSKGFTALVMVSLVAEGALDLSAPVRSILGADLPMIDDGVTVEHLLAHRSGIGDYLDEDQYELSDYILPVPVQDLVDTEQYVPILDGHPQVFPPGERFAYNNGGFVVLALIAERVSGVGYHDLVRDRVTDPAGMVDTGFLRSDESPGRVALGYVDDGPRSNVFHLPVRGTGDGGIHTTVADVSAFWEALFAGRIVPEVWVEEMTRRRSFDVSEGRDYGLGFWLHASSDAVILLGSDTGSSFWSMHDPTTGIGHTTISNQTDGAWAVSTFLDEQLGL